MHSGNVHCFSFQELARRVSQTLTPAGIVHSLPSDGFRHFVPSSSDEEVTPCALVDAHIRPSCGCNHRVSLAVMAGGDGAPRWRIIKTASATPARGRFCDDAQRILRYIKRTMADHPDYAVRAIHADEQAERAHSPSLADRWRAVAKCYRRLALQHTEMKYRRELNRMPNAKDRNI
jgi:hypothetical protein